MCEFPLGTPRFLYHDLDPRASECSALNQGAAGRVLSCNSAFQEAICVGIEYRTCQICIVRYAHAAGAVITQIILIAGINANVHCVCNLEAVS